MNWNATSQYVETESTKLWAKKKDTQKNQPSHLTISIKSVISVNQSLNLNLKNVFANKIIVEKGTRRV